jgi:hypothetical protein
VFVVFRTLAVNWKVCPTVKDAGTDPKTIFVAAGAVVGVVVDAPAPRPTISRLKLIPKTDALRPRPRIFDPAPIKSEFCFYSFGLHYAYCNPTD